MSSLYPRFALAALLFAAAALTGCNASNPENLPSLLGTSHDNGEPISTLGANYSIPQDLRHGSRLHGLPGRENARPTHHSL